MTPTPSTNSLTLEAVAALVAGTVMGDPQRTIAGIAPVDQAEPGQLGFVAAKGYLRFVEDCEADCLLVHEKLVDRMSDHVAERSMVVVSDPHAALRLLLEQLHPEPEAPSGVHPTAVVAESAVLEAGSWIGPYAVVEEGARVGAGAIVGAHSVVGRGTVIGAQSRLHPHVVLYPGVEIGSRVIVHSGCRLGVDGYGYVYVDGAHQKVPQVGRCVIDDDVEIGANSCIDRGSIGKTHIGAGTKIDNLVHIAHNVVVGRASLLVAQVGVAGSSRLGAGVQLGGQVGVSGHLSIGDGARLGAQAGVISDVPAGSTFWGTPARPRGETLRRLANMGKVEGLARRVKALEESNS